MDPLSVTASLLTVIGTVKQVGKGLKQLKALKQAPQELDDLLDENSQFEAILKAIDNAPWSSSSVQPELKIILSKAYEKLTEFDALIQYTLTEAGTSRKVDRMQWVRKGLEVESLRSNLKDITLRIVALIGVETNTSVYQLSSGQKELNNQVAAAVSHLSRKIDEDRSLQSTLTDLLGKFRQVTFESDSEKSTSGTRDLDRSLLSPSRTKRSGEILSEFNIHRRQTINICSRDCRCKCHRRKTLAIPGLSRKFGHGYVETFGVSLLGSRCDNQSCKARFAPRININYILPSWIAMRMILIRYNASSPSGPEFLFKIARVVSWNNDGLRAIENDDLDLLKSAVANGSFTPYDIDQYGDSLLGIAAKHGHPDILRHLVPLGVHSQTPIMNDPSSRSFGLLLWEMHVVSQYSFRRWRLSLTMTSFWRSIDFDEESEAQGFTTLHKIVCELDLRSLDSELDLHPDFINKTDVYGRSALWYSVTYEAPEFVRCLLTRGADLNAGGNSVIVEAIRTGSSEILELLIASGSNFENLDTQCLLAAWRFNRWYKFYPNAEVYQANLLSIERLTIKHLIDVNWQSEDGGTMLMDMCRFMNPGAGRIKQLIRYGANVELGDNDGCTVLLHTFLGSDPEAFRTLVRAGARLDVRTHSGFTILHIAVLLKRDRVGTLRILDVMRELDLSGLDLDARDEDGFTAFDLLKKRNGIQWKSYWEKRSEIAKHFGYFHRVVAEVDVIRSLESLFHHIQDSQGTPPEQQYPPLAEYLCEKPDEDVVPGAWPL